MSNFLKKYYKWGIALAIIIAVGIVGEVLYNLPITKQSEYQYLTGEQIKTDGFAVTDDVCVSTGKGGKIELSFPEQYVDKLYYQYDYEGYIDPDEIHNKITVNVVRKNKEIEIADDNNYVWGSSIINIRQVTDKIVIELPEEAEGATIQRIAINNTTNHSMGRILFYMVCAALVLMLISIIKDEINWKPEWVFLSVAFSIGGVLLVTLPSHKVGLDEEIHFGRAFYLFDTFAGKETITVEPAMEDLITTSMANWPFSVAQSEEEHKLEKIYWNSNLQYDTGKPSDVNQMEGKSFQLYSISYLPQAMMIKLGALLRLDFTTIYMLGRMGNLIFYCGIVFLAIRHIAVGKRVMLVLALMPTALFSAVTYSYDAFVTAFSFLGIAYLITELVEKGKCISYKNCAIFTGALILASFPKPIYIPMIALALFFPASKFRSKKEKYIFKGIIAVALAGMLATFMLPAILEPNRAGDTRGGDTNIGQQLRYIFAKPWLYTKLLLSNISETLYSYTIGQGGLGDMGHIEVVRNSIPIGLLVGYTAITDSKGTNGERVERRHKIIVAIISFAIICLIWTALYLSFTPVGADVIHGVQGRYYLPVTMMILLTLGIKKVKIFTKTNIDMAIISAVSILILIATTYNSVIVNAF